VHHRYQGLNGLVTACLAVALAKAGVKPPVRTGKSHAAEQRFLQLFIISIAIFTLFIFQLHKFFCHLRFHPIMAKGKSQKPLELADKFGQFAIIAFAQMKAQDEELNIIAAMLPKLLLGGVCLPAAREEFVSYA
jgi:hypothetical protein